MKKFNEFQEVEEAASFKSSYQSQKTAMKLANQLSKIIKNIRVPDPAGHRYNWSVGGDNKMYKKDELFVQKKLDKIIRDIEEIQNEVTRTQWPDHRKP